MPTAACIELDLTPIDAVRMDIQASDEMLVRLKRSNHALDKLRRALERDEPRFSASDDKGLI